MKKIAKIVLIAIVLTIGTITAGNAQVFIMENEVNQREDSEEVLGWPVNPQNGNGSSVDDYVPLGGGILWLAALGGAYLVNKRKKSK